MAFDKEQLDRIYRRTCGYCHLCYSKLARKNYGRPGKRGAWEVDHSVPSSKGGTDHLNNLLAACATCNRDKSSVTTKTARSWNGKARAPLSPAKRRQAKAANGLLAAICMGLVGFATAGPIGAAIGALAGGRLGSSQNPDKQ
jgi:5-methylcytosine-specific restriction endonuclease McrA